MKASRKIVSIVLTALSVVAVGVAVTPLFSVLYYVALKGASIISVYFLTHAVTPPTSPGGMGNAIQGTLILVAEGSLIGLPLGILSGVYISEFGDSWFGPSVRFMGDVLAGIPSIVTGVFIYALIVIPFHHFSAIAGGVAIGTMMVPIVSNTTAEAMKLVPNSLREASLALGAHKWRSALLMVSNAKGGIATGSLLAISRITGETAPLLLTALDSTLWFSGFQQPIASLTVTIYDYAVSPFKSWQVQAWGASLVLVVIVLVINIAVRLATGGTRHAQ